MATITLPVWALAAAVGLPAACLIWIVAALIRKRRKAGRAAADRRIDNHVSGSGNGVNRFRDDLLAQQIDIIFNGLSALIETERVKLRSLFSQGLPQSFKPPAVPPPKELCRIETEDTAQLHESRDSIGQKVADAMAAGHESDDIASQLGLSHAEVVLAMKLNQAQSASSYRKLEAVA